LGEFSQKLLIDLKQLYLDVQNYESNQFIQQELISVNTQFKLLHVSTSNLSEWLIAVSQLQANFEHKEVNL